MQIRPRNKCQSAPGTLGIDTSWADWATALRVAARCGSGFSREYLKPGSRLKSLLQPFPSARVASRHRSGQQRGSREVYSGALNSCVECGATMQFLRGNTTAPYFGISLCLHYGAKTWRLQCKTEKRHPCRRARPPGKSHEYIASCCSTGSPLWPQFGRNCFGTRSYQVRALRPQ